MAKEDKDTSKAEKVHIFNNDWDCSTKHHEGSFFGGVILVLVGVLFLLNTFGIVSWSSWNYILQFWPVLLIIWGVQAILGRNPFSRFLVGLFTLIVVGLIILFGITKVNPVYKHTLPPQINNMLNQMDNMHMNGDFNDR